MINYRCYFHVAWFIFIFVLTAEILQWAYVLNRHAVWLNETEHLENRDCFKDAWLRIYMASVMACGLSIIAFFWEAYLVYQVFMKRMPHNTLLPWIVAGIQLSHIHFFAIIARCSCLDVENWPWLSRQISHLLNKTNFIGDK